MNEPAPVSAGNLRVLLVGLLGLGVPGIWLVVTGGPGAAWQYYPAATAVIVFVGIACVLGSIALFIARRMPKKEPSEAESVDPFQQEYLDFIVEEHKHPNTLCLGPLDSRPLDLEKVFIELRMIEKSAYNVQREIVADSKAASPEYLPENRPIWSFLQDIAKNRGIGLAVLGPPGSGKTTLLRHVALTFAQNRQAAHQLKAYLPLLLFLREHAESIQKESPSLGALAKKVYESRFGGFSSKAQPPENWFEKHLHLGNCIVLLDGLDEVANIKTRKHVSAWVDKQMLAYTKSLFVISARPGGYREAPVLKVNTLEAQPFNSEQVKRFVHHWYAMHQPSPYAGMKQGQIENDAHQKAKDLLDRIFAKPAIYDLTHNPLLLTMLVRLHDTRGRIPERRVELYAEICDVMLERWNAAKDLESRLSGAQLRDVLEPLAAYMRMQGKVELSKKEARHIIDEPLDSVGYPPEKKANFLSKLQDSSGLLAERENNRWSFAHLSFQEYLAAAHFHKQAEALPFDKLVSDPSRNETLRLYAALGDATKLVQACLKANTIGAFTLMSECLEEAKDITPEVRTLAEQRLIADLDSKEPDRRKLAAEVKLVRRLKGLHPLNNQDDVAIDLEYISMAEYQLFISDPRATGHQQHPDHWGSHQFPEGQAKSPVAGVRAENAKAFVHWLNLHHPRECFQYRLPSIEEALESPALPRENIATWCTNAESELILDTLPKALEDQANIAIISDSELRTPSSHGLFFGFSLNLNLALDLALDLTRTGNPNLTRDLNLNLTRAFNLARDLNIDLKLNATRALARALARALDLALNLARGLDLVARSMNENGSLHALEDALKRRDFGSAAQRANTLLSHARLPIQRTVKLLLNILALLQAGNERKRRYAFLRYAARLLEYAWLGSDLALSPKNQYPLTPKQRDALLATHHWLKLTAARLEGKIPAFEGIRIVRERIKQP